MLTTTFCTHPSAGRADANRGSEEEHGNGSRQILERLRNDLEAARRGNCYRFVPVGDGTVRRKQTALSTICCAAKWRATGKSTTTSFSS